MALAYPQKWQDRKKLPKINSARHKKAGKKSLTSCPLFAAAGFPAVKFVCFQTFLIDGWLLGSSFFLDALLQRVVYFINPHTRSV